MKIGVISDTHGFLDPKVFERFAGVSHILHGGDIGPDSLIAELEVIAPVTAVLGNTDNSPHFQLTEVVALGGRKFLVQHIVNPHALTADLLLHIVRERPQVVVFGHTHRPLHERIGGTLFFNPGYAGKPKFGQDRSVAILHCDKTAITPEFLSL